MGCGRWGWCGRGGVWARIGSLLSNPKGPRTQIAGTLKIASGEGSFRVRSLIVAFGRKASNTQDWGVGGVGNVGFGMLTVDSVVLPDHMGSWKS